MMFKNIQMIGLIALTIAAGTACSKEETSTLPALAGNDVRIVSYNLLFEKSLPSDESQRWSNRIKNVENIFNSYNSDIIGSQEACTWQVNMLLRDGNFARLGTDLAGGTEKPYNENEALFYRVSRFDVLDSGQFWFSTTPDKAGSYSWDATYARACVWGLFKEKTSGKKFYVFNVHLHTGFPVAVIEEVKLLASKIQEINSDNLPLVCTGDFNSTPDTDQIKLLLSYGILKDSHDVAASRSGGDITYHGFSTDPTYGWRIDYVFVNDLVSVGTYRVVDEERTTQKWGSDHFPVVVDVTLK